jgi:hypothetical protein
MTLGMAWVRTKGTTQLLVASDSRLSGGRYWDSNPKIILLPRSDCVMSFAGDTNDAYPLMFRSRASASDPRGARRPTSTSTAFLQALRAPSRCGRQHHQQAVF